MYIRQFTGCFEMSQYLTRINYAENTTADESLADDSL